MAVESISYRITDDPLEDKYTKRIPKKVLDQIQGFHKKITRKPKEMIPQLMDFVKKYPNVPLFYNYLAVAYGRIGDRKKCESTILENIKKQLFSPNHSRSSLLYHRVGLLLALRDLDA